MKRWSDDQSTEKAPSYPGPGNISGMSFSHVAWGFDETVRPQQGNNHQQATDPWMDRVPKRMIIHWRPCPCMQVQGPGLHYSCGDDGAD